MIYTKPNNTEQHEEHSNKKCKTKSRLKNQENNPSNTNCCEINPNNYSSDSINNSNNNYNNSQKTLNVSQNIPIIYKIIVDTQSSPTAYSATPLSEVSEIDHDEEEEFRVYLEKVHHSNSKQGKLTFIDDPPQITEPTNTKKIY